MTEFFGLAPPRDGENSLFKDLGRPYFGTNVTGRVMLMVFNIVDTNLFSDENNCNFINSSYPSYVAGYSWGYTDSIYDRNIIQLDNWQWDNRTLGPDVNTFRPFVIESTVAHEYQHELNAWLNGGQASFLNEGCHSAHTMVLGHPRQWFDGMGRSRRYQHPCRLWSCRLIRNVSGGSLRAGYDQEYREYD
jgi:hypothetical protein